MRVPANGPVSQPAHRTVGPTASPAAGLAARLAAGLALAMSVVVAGCLYPLHEPPKPGLPAATVKFRINHVPRPTGALRFHLLIDSKQVVHRPPRQGPSATWTRVKPGWRMVSLKTLFYVTRSYQQTYTTYSSYKCGNSTCSRSQTRQRTVYRTVPTGVCRSPLMVYVRNKETYLLSYSYLGHRSCHLTCHRQVHSGGGRFHLVPCTHTRAVRYD